MPPEDDNLSPDERSTQELVERIESVNRRLEEFGERIARQNELDHAEESTDNIDEQVDEYANECPGQYTFVDPSNPEECSRQDQRRDMMRNARQTLLDAAQQYLDEQDNQEEERSPDTWEHTPDSNPENDIGSGLGSGEVVKYCYEKNLYDFSARKFYTVDGVNHGGYHIVYATEDAIAVEGFYYEGKNHGTLTGWDMERTVNLSKFYMKGNELENFPFLPPKPSARRTRFHSLEM